jgi:putative ABC transport system ATP-binding protein
MPLNGSFKCDGVQITKLKGRDLIKYRRNDIGFVFQFYNLIQNLTAKENVELAVQLCKDHLDPDVILDKVGLKDRKDNFPSQLSRRRATKSCNCKSYCQKSKATFM